MNEHDPFCKCYYPALTDPKTCTWCYVIRRVRIDEYLQAWNEGFGIGFEEGKEKAKEIYTNDCFECGYAGEWSTWICDNCKQNLYNETSAAGTSKPPTTTQKLDTLGFFNMGTTDYMCPFCVTPWKCNGPHIDEEDMENFLLYMKDGHAENND